MKDSGLLIAKSSALCSHGLLGVLFQSLKAIQSAAKEYELAVLEFDVIGRVAFSTELQTSKEPAAPQRNNFLDWIHLGKRD